MSLVRAVLAVLLVVTHPNVRDTLAITQTLEMAVITCDLGCGECTWSIMTFGAICIFLSRFHIMGEF